MSSSLLLVTCRKGSMEGMIIFTRASIKSGIPDYVTGNSWRYLMQSSLAAFDPENPDRMPESLTGNFFSACSPEISSDCKWMLFAGQQKQGDPWQIWGMNLDTRKVTQITSASENSTDPAFLPDGRILFTRSIDNDSLKSGHALFTCNADGTNLTRITFNPHVYFASSVLLDGRVIAISKQVFPQIGNPVMMVMRPDGTKSELFYKGNDGVELFSRGRETSDGKIFFVESDNSGGNKKSIVSVNYNRPLHTRINLTSSVPGVFYSVFPLEPGKLLVSYSPSGSDSCALYDFDTEKRTLGKQLFSSSDYSVLEAVVVREHEKPKKLPSEVDTEVKTGLLFCQNITVSGLTSPENNYSMPVAYSIEIIGIDSSLGVVEVKEDGSFYLKLSADMPFKIKTMDSEGNTLNGPGSWIWIRPNERRGCVGCHEDHEMVPANRFALAVRNQPVSIPVHTAGIREKEVELE